MSLGIGKNLDKFTSKDQLPQEWETDLNFFLGNAQYEVRKKLRELGVSAQKINTWVKRQEKALAKIDAQLDRDPHYFDSVAEELERLNR